MRMGAMKSRNKMIYLAMNVIFLGGWLLALIGLAMVQKYCKDHEQSVLGTSSFLSAEEIGKDCKKFYRHVSPSFPLFVRAPPRRILCDHREGRPGCIAPRYAPRRRRIGKKNLKNTPSHAAMNRERLKGGSLSGSQRVSASHRVARVA
jgi:hypothetical protein